MSNHTPAPWFVDANLEYDSIEICAMGPQGERVAYEARAAALVSDEERMANACLIAAAPELLEVLKEVLSLVSGCCDCWDLGATDEQRERISKLILRAEGKA